MKNYIRIKRMINNKLELEEQQIIKQWLEYNDKFDDDNDDFGYDEEFEKYFEKQAYKELKEYIKEIEKFYLEARKQGIIID